MKLMQKRLVVRRFVLALGVLLLSACNRIPDTVKIGVAQPLTGGAAALGQDLLNGVQMAVREINRDGLKIDGKPVTLEVVAMDDRADPEVGKQVAQQLVDAGVVAAIADLNSGVSIAAAPIYAAANVPQLAISTNPTFTELNLPTTFRLVANDNLQARAMGSFAIDRPNAKRFALVDDGTPYGKGLSEGVARELENAKRNLVLRQSLDDKTTDMQALAQRIKSESVDVLLTSLNDYQMLPLLDALKEIDYLQLTVVGADTLKTNAMRKGSDMVRHFYVTSPVLGAEEFIAGAPFLAKYQDAYKTTPAYGAQYTYDAVYVLVGAMRRAASVDPKKLTQTLRTFDGYAPVTGSMKWDQKGEQRYGMVGVYALRKGGWDLQLRSDQW